MLRALKTWLGCPTQENVCYREPRDLKVTAASILNTLEKRDVQSYNSTIVKPVLSGHSKIDKTKVLKTYGSLMQVENIAECSPWSIL